MGLYDRQYYREENAGFGLRGPTTIVGTLILINSVVFVADQLLFTQQLGNLLAAHVQTLTRPWLWWQFITYGFVHAPEPQHIIFNMLGLFFFGRDIEFTYGRKEFLRLYLTLIAVGSVTWAVLNRLQGIDFSGPLVGASGAVAGIIILYALHFPNRTLLLMFIIPVPAWLVGILLVVMAALGALGGSHDPNGLNVAYTVHLAGAAFAFLYYRFRWNLSTLLPSGFSLAWLKPRPRLRVHNPDLEDEDRAPADPHALSEEVDRILEKIHQLGESSLTRRERRILEDASRQYQQRRRSDKTGR